MLGAKQRLTEAIGQIATLGPMRAFAFAASERAEKAPRACQGTSESGFQSRREI